MPSFAALIFTSLIAMTGSAFAIPSTRLNVSIVLGVLVALWAFSFGRFRYGCMPTRLDSISNILRRRAPVQVTQFIVNRIIISMASMHPLRPWADENLKHQSVNSYHPSLTVSKQSASVIATSWATASDKRLAQHLPLQHLGRAPSASNLAIKGSHSTFTGHLIPRILQHWQPFLFSHHPSVALSFAPTGRAAQ